jgi:Uri superfamily endonuclease
MNQGVYALIIENKKDHVVQIGKLGTFLFKQGFYVYIGSALGKSATSLEYRLKRHLSSTKKLFWHIDFFLNSESVNIESILYANTSKKEECALASATFQIQGAHIPVPQFGASDCKKVNHSSHLFHFLLEKNELEALVKAAFLKINLLPICKEI